MWGPQDIRIVKLKMRFQMTTCNQKEGHFSLFQSWGDQQPEPKME